VGRRGYWLGYESYVRTPFLCFPRSAFRGLISNMNRLLRHSLGVLLCSAFWGFVRANAMADEELVVFLKALPDGRTAVATETVREEHRDPTKAEQKWLDQEASRVAQDANLKGGGVGFAHDRRTYQYTMVINDNSGKKTKVWQKQTWESINPNLAFSERVTVHDVVVHGERVAVLYSSPRSANIDVIRCGAVNNCSVEFSEPIRPLGSFGPVKAAHINWADQLYVTTELADTTRVEVWKVSSNSVDRVGP
jgi:hypothetical protein